MLVIIMELVLVLALVRMVFLKVIRRVLVVVVMWLVSGESVVVICIFVGGGGVGDGSVDVGEGVVVVVWLIGIEGVVVGDKGGGGIGGVGSCL